MCVCVYIYMVRIIKYVKKKRKEKKITERRKNINNKFTIPGSSSGLGTRINVKKRGSGSSNDGD